MCSLKALLYEALFVGVLCCIFLPRYGVICGLGSDARWIRLDE